MIQARTLIHTRAHRERERHTHAQTHGTACKASGRPPGATHWNIMSVRPKCSKNTKIVYARLSMLNLNCAADRARKVLLDCRARHDTY
eukprot:1395778-Pleurochrysis_carterae.AAC.1